MTLNDLKPNQLSEQIASNNQCLKKTNKTKQNQKMLLKKAEKLKNYLQIKQEITDKSIENVEL